MPLPKNAVEELEARILVLQRDARDFRNHAEEARALATSHDERAAEYEDRAIEISAILDRAFPGTNHYNHIHWAMKPDADELIYTPAKNTPPQK